MSKLGIVAKKDLKYILQSKALYLGLGILCIIFIPLIIGFGNAVNDLEQQGQTDDEVNTLVQRDLAMLSFVLSFLSIMTFCMIASGYSVITEKLKRTLESLLATPLTIREIWLGKSLAIFLPSVIMGILLTIVAVVIANMIYVISTTESFVVPPASSLVVCAISVPVIVFLLVCVITILQFILTNTRVVNAIFLGIIFGVGFGLTGTGVDPTSWNFSLLSLTFIVGLAILTIVLARFLTRERIILAIKGQ